LLRRRRTAFITNEVTPILKCSAPAARQITSHAPQTVYFVLSLQMREIAKSGSVKKQKQQSLFTIERFPAVCDEALN
jgi:hypothetical protein